MTIFKNIFLLQGRRVQICVNGTLPEILPFQTPILEITSCHAKLNLSIVLKIYILVQY